MWNLINSHIRIWFIHKKKKRPDKIGPRVVPLDTPRLGHSSLQYRFYFFLILILLFLFLNGVQNRIALHAQIYQITIALEVGRAAAMLFCLWSLAYPKKKFPKGRVTTPLKLGRAHSRSLYKTSRSSRIYTIRIRLREHFYWLTSQATGNQMDFSSKRLKTLNSIARHVLVLLLRPIGPTFGPLKVCADNTSYTHCTFLFWGIWSGGRLQIWAR